MKTIKLFGIECSVKVDQVFVVYTESKTFLGPTCIVGVFDDLDQAMKLVERTRGFANPCNVATVSLIDHVEPRRSKP